MKRGYSSAPQGSASGGPLVTSHLRDLDVELEMLKRKRLMIEQQQRMLSNERYDNQPLHNLPQYDQQQNFNQHQNYGQNRNYSHLYDNGSSERFTGSQFGQSFQSVRPNWDFEPSNRYIPQSTDFTPNRNTFGPKPKNPKPNFAPKPKKFNQLTDKNMVPPFKPKYGSSNKPNKSGPTKTVKNNFKPSKVTKPKNKVANKAPFNLQNQNPRKNLAKKAASLATEMEQDKDFWVFKADKPPNAKIVGRMELALGSLWKEAREHLTKNCADLLNNIHWQREIKKELRIRIRSVLLGKTVPNLMGIVQLYRNQFPPDTDDALLELCKEKDMLEKNKRSLPQKFLAEDDPERFFKTNFHNLYDKQMQKLFKKLSNIQEQENNRPIEDIIAELPDVFEYNEVEKDNVVPEDSIKDEPVEQPKTGLPEDEPVEQPKTGLPEDEPSEEKIVEVTLENGNNDDKATGDEAKQDNTTNQDNGVKNDDKNNESSIVTPAKTPLSQEEKEKFYLGLIDQLIQQSLPDYLIKNKQDIIKVFDIDKAFKFSRAAVLIETTKKAEKLCSEILPENQVFSDILVSKISNEDVEKSTIKEQKDDKSKFVKVVGKPDLPDKKIMKTFIDAYNPKSIKKHKHINNLLFIGFGCREDMDNILKENGTTVGNKKLIIQATNTFAGPKNHDDPNESTVSNDDLNKKEASNESTGLIDTLNTSQQAENHDSSVNISDDLDEQITDLLASVRQTDEEAKNESNGDVEILSENTVQVKQEHVETNGSEESKLPDITEESADDTVTVESKEANTRIEEVADKNNTAEAAVKQNDKVAAVKEENPSGRATPTRSSSRLTANVTPSSVRTRRASKLGQN